MDESVVMHGMGTVEEEVAKKRCSLKGLVIQLKEQILPIFVSHFLSLEVEEEHEPVRQQLAQLKSLWGAFLDTSEKLEKLFSQELVVGGDRRENCRLLSIHVQAIKKVADKIKREVRELGDALVEKILQLQMRSFPQKYRQFDEAYREVCELAFGLLFVDASGLTGEQAQHLGAAEFKLYRCLASCEKLQERKAAQEKEWIPLVKFPQLKFLFKNCLFSIFEYAISYKLISRRLAEQTKLLAGLEFSQELCRETAQDLQKTLGPLVEAHLVRYNGFPAEKKIRHHELSISRRQRAIGAVLAKQKALMGEINSLNWKVGREAKNVINMEKACADKGDLSIKQLFFLFEDIEKNLKKAEAALYTYTRLVGAVRKAPPSEAKLFSIKSLDFRHLLLAGDLKLFEGDLLVLYTASKNIYTSHAKGAR